MALDAMAAFTKYLMLSMSFLVLACSHNSPNPTHQSESYFPTAQWEQYADLNDSGFSPDKLEAVKKHFQSIGGAALFVVHDGKVLLSLGEPERRFRIHSIRKSIMSMVFGIYQNKGKINLDKNLYDLGLKEVVPLTDTEMQATVFDLLRARSGVYLDALGETNEMKKNKPTRGAFKPGAKWVYNNWDFNALISIFKKETGISLVQAIEKEVFSPLQFEDYRDWDKHIIKNNKVSLHPGIDYKLSARDLARFGMLHLRNGNLKNQQLLSSQWMKWVKTNQVAPNEENSWSKLIGGYSLLWWTFPVEESPSFSAVGVGMNFLTVIPDRDLVVVFRVNTFKENFFIHPDKYKHLLKLLVGAQSGKPSLNPKLSTYQPHKESENAYKTSRDKASQFVGDYTSKFGQHRVYYHNGFLFFESPLGTYRLKSKSDAFYVTEDSQYLVEFKPTETTKNFDLVFDKKGEVSKVVLYY